MSDYTIPTSAVWETARQLAECKRELAEAQAALRESMRFASAYPVPWTVAQWEAAHAVALKAALDLSQQSTLATLRKRYELTNTWE